MPRALRGRTWLALAGLALLLPALAPAQVRVIHAERQVPPAPNVQDKEDIWVLHFHFKDPRILTVDVPGRGKRLVWYMWYQVVNITPEGKQAEPHTLIPDFELITSRNTVHHDEVLPAVQEAIRKIEDPTGRYDIQNSVTISNKPIPPTKPDALPKAVTGVAIWSDVFEKAPDTTHFTIYVTGLSNGWSIDDNGTIRRKTLKLDFKRSGDGRRVESEDIRWAEKAEWIYRAASVDFPGSLPPPVKSTAIKVPMGEKPPER